MSKKMNASRLGSVLVAKRTTKEQTTNGMPGNMSPQHPVIRLGSVGDVHLVTNSKKQNWKIINGMSHKD
jgi:hypothetical protein